MNNENTTTEFFGSEYIAYASYDCTRKIASAIDGLKPTARKIIYTVMDLKIDQPKKVDAVTAKVSEHTEYLHGQTSISGVIVNIAQDFIGGMNIPLIQRDGNFGTRLVPAAAASRYIRTCQEEYLKNIFNQSDNPVIGNLEFEGTKIEPKFFIPIVPLLVINGSEGIAVGYAQKILPRNYKNVMKYIFGGLKDESLLLPYYKGFNGKIVQTGDKSFDICGSIKNVNTTTYEITEVPVGYTYSKYIKILDKLSDSGLISSYEDLCDTNADTFNFIIKVKRDVQKKLSKLAETELLDKFKLISRVTENYTCLNENGQIEVFDGIPKIIRRFTEVRIDLYKKRKEYILAQKLLKIKRLKSKILFISKVDINEIDIKNTKKKELIQQLEDIDGIIKIDESFDYLLNMSIWSINKDSQAKALKEVKAEVREYKVYEKRSVASIWSEEYEELCNQYK